MAISDFLRTNLEKLRGSKFEEALFEIAASEVDSNDLRPGLLAKAYVRANGDESRAHAEYIRLRVEQLRLEHGAAQEVQQHSERTAAPSSVPCCVRLCEQSASSKLGPYPMCQDHYTHFVKQLKEYARVRGGEENYLSHLPSLSMHRVVKR